jgi:hypothetical protein
MALKRGAACRALPVVRDHERHERDEAAAHACPAVPAESTITGIVSSEFDHRSERRVSLIGRIPREGLAGGPPELARFDAIGICRPR